MNTNEEDKGQARKILGHGRKWLREAKDEFTSRASEFGEAEEIWAGLEQESDHIESILRAERPEIYPVWLEELKATTDWLWSMDPGKPMGYLDKPVVEAAMFTGTTSGSVIASTSYPVLRPEQWESLRRTTFELSERRKHREKVLVLLLKLSPQLREQFEQAWQTWHSATKERRKGAMYVMRDTLHDTVVHLSRPGERFPAPSTYRSDQTRIEWLADNLVSDAASKKLVRTRAHRYPDLVGRKGLSKAHDAHLDEGEALTLLLEGQTFLLELLTSLDWNLVKAKGLCS